jgi:hypothetical protein
MLSHPVIDCVNLKVSYFESWQSEQEGNSVKNVDWVFEFECGP